MFYAPDLECARRAAVHLNGLAAKGEDGDFGDRLTVRYIVERYPIPGGRQRDKDFAFEWGVVRRWKYSDQPDLGEFGGAFIPLNPEFWS